MIGKAAEKTHLKHPIKTTKIIKNAKENCILTLISRGEKKNVLFIKSCVFFTSLAANSDM